MKRTFTLVLLILFTLLASGCATMSMSGTYTLGRGKTLRGNLVVTSGHATLGESSRVTGSVFVTSGHLDVYADAEIEGNVFVTSGNVNLGRRAVVRGDVIMTSGNVNRAESARVEGKISSNGFDIGASIIGTYCLPPVVLLGVLLYWLIDQGRRRAVTEPPAARISTPVVGVVLILIGAIFLAQDLIDLNLNWWALFILIPAVGSLANVWGIYRAQGRLTAATRGPLVGGVALLLVAGIFLFGLSWGTMWPLFLIVVGMGVLVAR
jgi:hypothetical protein